MQHGAAYHMLCTNTSVHNFAREKCTTLQDFVGDKLGLDDETQLVLEQALDQLWGHQKTYFLELQMDHSIERSLKRAPESVNINLDKGEKEFQYARGSVRGAPYWRNFRANEGVEFGPSFGVEKSICSGTERLVWACASPIALLWDEPVMVRGKTTSVVLSEAKTVATVTAVGKGA